MTQYPATIELSSLDGTNGFRIDGEAANDAAGQSVASAGDVNHDGFADLIVGVPFADPNGFESGVSYVVFGKASGFGATLQPSDLDGTNGFQINGEAGGDLSGFSVASAGDVNGDGFADVIVGADGADPHGAYSGASYVVFGKASGFNTTFELSALNGTNGFQISGEALDDRSGFSAASAGDVNGDGFADLIVGAFGADPNGSYSGASYLVFGKASGFAATLELSALDGTNGFQINGEAANDESGFPVASAGDVNGDGFADLIVGAAVASPNGGASGASYVVFGKASGFAATLELSALDGTNGFQINGVAASDYSGSSVACAGDVNGDGFADLIVGARYADPNGISQSGASYVVFGKASAFAATLELSRLNGSNGFRINGEMSGDRSGTSVAQAGDVNGDGFDDLLVGATGADPNGSNSGASYVVFGKASGFGVELDLLGLDGNNGFRIDGVAAGDGVGRSIAGAGDVNGDGFADLILGAPYADLNGGSSGASYVVFGFMPGEAVTRSGTGIANTIHGGNFDDTLSGLSGDDQLFGYQGDDTILGGDGNDAIDAGAGDDLVKGGSGDDSIQGGTESDALYGGSGADNLTGDAGSDVLDGGSGNDTLGGGNSADTLIGGDGRDILSGGAGDDRLVGGDAKDIVTGGAGADRFVYGSASDSTSVNFDLVKGADFASDQWDVAGHITGIDAAVVGGLLTSASFDTQLAGTIGAGKLGAHHAVLYTPSNGDLSGKPFLIVDLNGIAGYQASADLVVRLNGASNLASLDTGDFV